MRCGRWTAVLLLFLLPGCLDTQPDQEPVAIGEARPPAELDGSVGHAWHPPATCVDAFAQRRDHYAQAYGVGLHECMPVTSIVGDGERLMATVWESGFPAYTSLIAMAHDGSNAKRVGNVHGHQIHGMNGQIVAPMVGPNGTGHWTWFDVTGATRVGPTFELSRLSSWHGSQNWVLADADPPHLLSLDGLERLELPAWPAEDGQLSYHRIAFDDGQVIAFGDLDDEAGRVVAYRLEQRTWDWTSVQADKPAGPVRKLGASLYVFSEDNERRNPTHRFDVAREQFVPIEPPSDCQGNDYLAMDSGAWTIVSCHFEDEGWAYKCIAHRPGFESLRVGGPDLYIDGCFVVNDMIWANCIEREGVDRYYHLCYNL